MVKIGARHCPCPADILFLLHPAHVFRAFLEGCYVSRAMPGLLPTTFRELEFFTCETELLLLETDFQAP